MSAKYRSGGFTLIELLVSVAVIGLLVAMLLPAEQSAREAARRVACANNLRQLGLALNNFESSQGHFPSSWKPARSMETGSVDGWSAQIQLAPYFEEGTLVTGVDFDRSYHDQRLPSGEPVGSARVPLLLCPSEPGDRVRLEGGIPAFYPLNYGANVGVWFVYDPKSGRGGQGAFYPASDLGVKRFTDGLSKTIGFAEVKAWNPYFRNAGHSHPMRPGPNTLAGLGGDFKPTTGHTESVDGRSHQSGVTGLFGPNTRVPHATEDQEFDVDWTNQQEGKSKTVATYAAVTARSHHRGGVTIVRLDGSSEFVVDGVEVTLWQSMFTRNGTEHGEPFAK